ncbi:IucA/IucC family protein [Streptomyces sp. NPDC090306]|uniref:IucA/IucC family protein n=1 Tax=Streptomyces sp. NPDC090306 TaxID=3365961 RepID=UPI003812B16D
MNAIAASDGCSPAPAPVSAPASAPDPAPAPAWPAAPELSAPGRAAAPRRHPESVPRQQRRTALAGRLHGPDPVEHPDPHTAAQAAAVENLLRCWVRETGLPEPEQGTLRVPLPASGTALLVPVRYWSPTGLHRFGPARLAYAPADAATADAVTVAALLGRETLTARGDAAGPPSRLAVHQGAPALDALPGAGLADVAPGAVTRGDVTDLAARVTDSVRRTAVFLRERRGDRTDSPDRFLAAEQALVLGHPLHPAPKSREGLSEAEGPLYSPELRGSFALHWLGVDPSLVAADSAWTERGRRVPADLLAARPAAGADMRLPAGFTALPMHPWQLREVRQRASVAALFDAGLLRDLGRHGAPWYPTSSVRTVHRPDAPAMLKLSLGLRITNSRRENLRKELHRGVEVHRLLRGGLARRWHAAHPGFDIVRDPAWLAVDDPDGVPVPGLDVVIRHNPFRPSDDVSCVAGLVSPRPGPADAGPGALRSRLAEVVTRLAARTGRPRGAVAAEWFLRYLEHVVRPVLWLDAEAGIALEAHQQNTLVLLDPDGWPCGGRYRDNQGYYFRASRRAELDALLPGIGGRSETFVSDDVTDERFAYYLALNNVCGLIGAFGSQGLADESLLLAAFRRFLGEVACGPRELRTPLAARLLDSPTLRCKANLLTRLCGLDELVGPVDTQSVYVTVANPLRA